MFEIMIWVFGMCFISVVGLVVLSCFMFGDGEKEQETLQDGVKMRTFMKKYEEYEKKKVG